MEAGCRSRGGGRGLAAEVVTRGLAEAISASTVRRWLSADAFKPWQHRSWIFPRDPQFEVKAARVLDLYARQWQGRPLGQDEYVISADEKSQLQALRRRHDGEPPGPGRTRRVEFEYTRGGTLAYFAAYDVHRAQVIGATAPTTGIEPFTDLVTQVMTTQPYASARRVFWVVDNGSSHNGARSIERTQTAATRTAGSWRSRASTGRAGTPRSMRWRPLPNQSSVGRPISHRQIFPLCRTTKGWLPRGLWPFRPGAQGSITCWAARAFAAAESGPGCGTKTAAR